MSLSFSLSRFSGALSRGLSSLASKPSPSAGRGKEGVATLETCEQRLRALEASLADNSWVSAGALHYVLKNLRRMPEGQALTRRALQLASDAGIALTGVSLSDAVVCYARNGDHAGVLAVERDMLASSEALGDAMALGKLVHAHVLLGGSQHALELLEGVRRAGTAPPARLLTELLASAEEPPLLFDAGRPIRINFRSEKEAAQLACKLRASALGHALLRHLCAPSSCPPREEEVAALAARFTQGLGLEEEGEEWGSSSSSRAAAASRHRQAQAHSSQAPRVMFGRVLWLACLTRLLTSAALAPALHPQALAPAVAAILAGAGLHSPALDREAALGLYLDATGLSTEVTLEFFAASGGPGFRHLARALAECPPSRRCRASGNHKVKQLHLDRAPREAEACAVVGLLELAQGGVGGGGGGGTGGMEALVTPEAVEALLGLRGKGTPAAQQARGPAPALAALQLPGDATSLAAAAAPVAATLPPFFFQARSASASSMEGDTFSPILTQLPVPGSSSSSSSSRSMLVFGGTPSSEFSSVWAATEVLGPCQWLDLHLCVAVGGYVHLLRWGGAPVLELPPSLHESIVCALLHRGYLSAAVQVLGVLGWAQGQEGSQAAQRVQLQGPFAEAVEELMRQVAASGLVRGDFEGFRERLLSPLAPPGRGRGEA